MPPRPQNVEDEAVAAADSTFYGLWAHNVERSPDASVISTFCGLGRSLGC
jgi:hypothetical protein